MVKNKRAILIVLDGVGAGELPDAGDYSDVGSNTLGNIASALGGLHLPHLGEMGLGNVISIQGVPPVHLPCANYGKMTECSPGKDSISGHWELTGVPLQKPFPTYPHGFPPEVIKRFELLTGIHVIGNKHASGTEIIRELGEEHLKTGKLIVYTSADSVFQITAHERLYPPPELYRLCEIARVMLKGEHEVGRVIARPFDGEGGNFFRTAGRKDFSVAPPAPTILNLAESHGIKVTAIGKIKDLFSGSGIAEHIPSTTNSSGVRQLLELLETPPCSAGELIVITLVDFDMLWGHRNDVVSFGAGLEEFDAGVAQIKGLLRDEELLIITADHGNDPTTPSTDHSREYVPVLVYRPGTSAGKNLGTRPTFADAGATIADFLGFQGTGYGQSLI